MVRVEGIRNRAGGQQNASLAGYSVKGQALGANTKCEVTCIVWHEAPKKRKTLGAETMRLVVVFVFVCEYDASGR